MKIQLRLHSHNYKYLASIFNKPINPYTPVLHIKYVEY